MGYKMKGMSFLQGQSPMKKVNAGGKKTIPGEDTDIIRQDKKGRDYALSMYNNASGIMKGDTLFTPRYKIPSVYGYVMGGEDYDAIETKDSKKRKKGPKSYTLKTQPSPTKSKHKKTKEQLLKEGFSQVEADQMMKTGATTGKQPGVRRKINKQSAKKKKSQDFVPAYPGADISKAEYDKARKAGVRSEAEFAEYKAKKKKKAPTKMKGLKFDTSKGWKKGKAYTTDGGVKGHYVTDPKGKKYFMTSGGKLHTGQIDDLKPKKK